MNQLDETLRRRMRELAESEISPLGAIERQRILSRLREQDPRPRPPWILPVIAVAGLLLVALGRGHETGDVDVEPRPANVAERSEPRARAPLDAPPRVVATGEAPCAGAPVPVAHETRYRGGRRALDLGERARFVLFRGAYAELEREACRTVLTLREGRVAVHARDLRGGELVVRTRAGDVVVHGTVFDVSVARDAARLRVSVAEGVVGVTGGTDDTRVEAGRALEREGPRERLSDLTPARTRTLLDLLRDPASNARAPRGPTVEEEPPRGRRGEVVGGVPMLHEPTWSRRGGVP